MHERFVLILVPQPPPPYFHGPARRYAALFLRHYDKGLERLRVDRIRMVEALAMRDRVYEAALISVPALAPT